MREETEGVNLIYYSLNLKNLIRKLLDFMKFKKYYSKKLQNVRVHFNNHNFFIIKKIFLEGRIEETLILK